MKSFLIRRKLWRIVTGDITQPIIAADEPEDKFADRLEDWDSKNHQIITWFRNTSVPAIHVQFADYDSAKEIWDFLANRYRTTRLAHYYQLWTMLLSLKQESGQFVNDFLAQVHPLWNQISQAKISEDHLHLIQVLMALRPEYEVVRASLLHRHPLPSLEAAIQEIIFEETRLNLDKRPQFDIALATTQSSQQKFVTQVCKNCNHSGHTFSNCPIVECKYCHNLGHILEHCPTRPPRPKGGFSKSKSTSRTRSSSITAAATKGSKALTKGDLEALFKQVISSNTSIAMSTTSGTSSWFFDSACCNHMTNTIKSLSFATPISSLPSIHTTNGTHMHITHTGHVSTSNLSLPDTYYIPHLTLNLISVGQLCEQGLNVIFSSFGVQVQDPQTRQILGAGRRVGWLFELQSLHLPSKYVSAATIHSSTHQWHLRLGHASASKIQPLISRGLLGTTKFESFDCLNCKLAKQPALSFTNSDSISENPFSLIHSDTWGPSPIPSINGFRYFVLFVDDYSRFTWIYFLKRRSELSQIYITFANMIKTQFSCHIKTLRTDNAMEYKDSSLLQFLSQQGIVVQRSCPHTSQQNGRA